VAVQGVVEMVSAAMELPATPRYSVDLIADRDWVAEVQRGWRPILIDDLMLRFPWHSAADVSAYLDSQGVKDAPKYELTLAGGMAFGTGEHATTRLCCSWLRRQIGQEEGANAGVRVMDYGAGSGVLGLAALVFGAAEAYGVEIDPDSISAAHENAALNSLPGFKCFLPAPTASGPSAAIEADIKFAQRLRGAAESGEGLAQPLPPECGSFDMVVANILAGPLVRLAPEIGRLCRPGGQLALSGILEPQAAMIQEAYAPFFEDLSVEANDRGWILVTGRRM
jgi:ribosomal protein L11 methyltransferase